MPYIEAGDVSVVYTEYAPGNASTVLLLHGRPDDASTTRST